MRIRVRNVLAVIGVFLWVNSANAQGFPVGCNASCSTTTVSVVDEFKKPVQGPLSIGKKFRVVITSSMSLSRCCACGLQGIRIVYGAKNKIFNLGGTIPAILPLVWRNADGTGPSYEWYSDPIVIRSEDVTLNDPYNPGIPVVTGWVHVGRSPVSSDLAGGITLFDTRYPNRIGAGYEGRGFGVAVELGLRSTATQLLSRSRR